VSNREDPEPIWEKAIDDLVRKAPDEHATKRNAVPRFDDLKRVRRLADLQESLVDSFAEPRGDARPGIA
jgi:hypothetical protein